LLHHERRAFLEFFLIYFLSVSFLILASGFFYFAQMKNQYLKAEEFSLIEYARQLKMGNNLSQFDEQYKSVFSDKVHKHIDIKNFSINQDFFMKYIPQNKKENYFQVFKSTKGFNQKLFMLKIKIALVQLGLFILFGFISYKLAKNALLPLEESINTLDKFAKDLIHDLNTPVTSIKLNMKLLKKDPNFRENKALQRLNKSAHTISELHENLTILLQEETFQIQEVNVLDIAKEVMQTQKQIYPNLDFSIEDSILKVKINSNAMKQILQNIVSNACKYNRKDGSVKIYVKNYELYIEDNGKGIRNPKKIFERSFSEKNSSGIGLDIVKRLAKSMNIDIKVQSNQNGSIFTLDFKV
jgi:two-component system OmpR family sensor kinase